MEKVKTAKLHMLRRDFETLSMKESDTIDSFFTQVIGLITQIRSHGEILEEIRIVEKILRCLPSRFEAVVVAIEETKDLSQFTVDELSASLMSHEHRLSREQIPLLSKHSRLRCLSTKEKVEAEQITEVVEEAKTEADIILQAQAEGAAIRTKMKGQANSKLMDKDKNPKNVLLTCNIVQDKQEDFWFLDSGCSNHMTGNIEMLANLDENVKFEVTTGTDSKISVKGKGRVSIRARNGEQMIVPEVYYVPGLKCNLLSIGQLIDKGYNVFFKDDMCTIRDIPPSKKIIAQVQMTSIECFLSNSGQI
eukprot:PITA_11762